MKHYILFFIVLVLFDASCANAKYENTSNSYDYEKVPSNQNYEELDSLAIGDIYLGINEQTFHQKKKAFLKAHPKLDNLQIESFDGFFFNGRLYEIIIKSTKREVMIKSDFAESEMWHKLVGGDDKVQKEQAEIRNRIYNNWTYLYKGKYPSAIVEDNGCVSFTKGKCTFEITDDYSDIDDALIEAQQYSEAAAKGNFHPTNIKHYRRSVINIYNSEIRDIVLQNAKDKLMNISSKDLDVL